MLRSEERRVGKECGRTCRNLRCTGDGQKKEKGRQVGDDDHGTRDTKAGDDCVG